MLKEKLFAAVVLSLFAAGNAVAIVSPKDGGKLPLGFYEMKAKDPTAFTMKHAWVEKTRRIKELRTAYLLESGPQALAAGLPQAYVVSGTVQVPVFLCEFSNVAGPFDYVAVQNKLFSNPSGTITDYYDEVSYGNVNMTGTVYDWVTLSGIDTYYEGPTGCYGLCSSGHVGQLITEVLDFEDPSVNFGQYDNDGPDGIPNSGDDDGFVDFVSFVHSEFGAECGGNNNIWSHRWNYEGWPESGGLPYTTNDAAAGGGFIQISDYTIQPVRNCAGGTMIDIGVFCHEFGHAFGLPDLYDTNGGGNGVGWWCIMGSGNWNTPASPAHPCAWTRAELGWVTPTNVTWQGGAQTVAQVETSAQVYRLPFTTERFRRSTACVIDGTYSLYCGLTPSEGNARGWGTQGLDAGYGNNWFETIEREFSFDGTTPVTFTYDYRYDTEADYDYAFAVIDVEGTNSLLAIYTGSGSGTANVNITPYLTGLTPPATYKLKFFCFSDFGWSDEDGAVDSDCGLIVIDNVSVTGGGESYTTDFESYADGWHQSLAENLVTEYWMVENRQRVGFDANLVGTGLLVYHVEESVMHSTMGNSGGSSNQRVRGVVVEEADGLFNLNGGILNRGDTGDPFPGSTNNTTFNSLSNPASLTNAWATTRVELSSISASGSSMTAFMRAGDPAPVASAVSPNDIDNDQVAVDVVITGSAIRYGATFLFTYAGGGLTAQDANDIVATSLRWIDPTRLEGTLNVYSKTGGPWDLVVTNPDGQQFTLASAININQIVATQLASARIEVVNGAVRLEYVLNDREESETIRLSRSISPDLRWIVVADGLEPPLESELTYRYIDDDVIPGRTYSYRLDVVTADGEVRELHRSSATVPAGELALEQNFPNPFNPATTIAFYMPERGKVRLEVFDVAGRLVTRLAEGVFDAGPYRLGWNGTNAAGDPVGSGVYVYRLTAGGRTMTKKMVLLK